MSTDKPSGHQSDRPNVNTPAGSNLTSKSDSLPAELANRGDSAVKPPLNAENKPVAKDAKEVDAKPVTSPTTSPAVPPAQAAPSERKTTGQLPGQSALIDSVPV